MRLSLVPLFMPLFSTYRLFVCKKWTSAYDTLFLIVNIFGMSFINLFFVRRANLRLKPSRVLAHLGVALTLGWVSTCGADELDDGAVSSTAVVLITGDAPLPVMRIRLRQSTSNIQTLNASEISVQHTDALADALERNIGGMTLNSVQGNPFQVDINYRGFTASPLMGTPQGLSVFQDGVRINEPFGDVVNFDYLPLSAISTVQVIPGSNPVFGLNTLGGAIALTTKSGLTAPGASVEISAASFKRKSSGLEFGGSKNGIHYFLTGLDVIDPGWAAHNSSHVRQFFGKLGYETPTDSIDLSVNGADNHLQGSQTIPASFLDRRDAAYTYPDMNLNQGGMSTLYVSRVISSDTQLSSTFYYRKVSTQNFSSNVATNAGDVSKFSASNVISNLSQHGNGGQFQLSTARKLFGHDNSLNVGVSYDASNADYMQAAQDANFTITRGSVGVDAFVTQTHATTRNTNASLYFLDSFMVDQHLLFTAAGRYNRASIEIVDLSGGQPLLNGRHEFNRFNPATGLSYSPNRTLTLYANYNEGTRTPSAIELTCADPDAPCSLPNSFVADPALKQVRAKTIELGMRGTLDATSGWGINFYRTKLFDDIEFVATQGATASGYFQNVGVTQRMGIDLEYHRRYGHWTMYGSYVWTDARYENSIRLPASANSNADPNGVIQVEPGDKIPSIPLHTFKLRFEFAPSETALISTSLMSRAGIYARGDENNRDRNGMLGGYTVVNLNGVVRSKSSIGNIEYFFKVDNLFDIKYSNFALLGNNYFNGPKHSFDPERVQPEQFQGVGAPRTITLGFRYEWN